jgi:hypothetical protein
MRLSGRTGCPEQGIADRALLGVAGKAMLMPVEPTVQGVLAVQLAFGIDIAAVDSNRWGAHKPGPFGCGLVGDHGGPDLRVDAQLSRDPLDQRQRRWAFGQCSTYSTSTTRPGTW